MGYSITDKYVARVLLAEKTIVTEQIIRATNKILFSVNQLVSATLREIAIKLRKYWCRHHLVIFFNVPSLRINF